MDAENIVNFSPIEDKVALITGSAVRVGREIAKKLHRNGFRVCIHYNRSSDTAETLVEELNDSRVNSAFCIQQDLRTRNAGEDLLKKFTDNCNRIDLLVNNASVFYENKLETSVNTWDSIFSINLRSIYFLSVKFKTLLENNKGCIVNISDINADIPRKGYPIYSVSKSGVNSLTKSLAIELAPNIRVNAVAPGAIMWAENESEDVRKEAILKTPLEEIGHPKDISDAVLFLTRATYVTGQILNIDGGRSIKF